MTWYMTMRAAARRKEELARARHGGEDTELSEARDLFARFKARLSMPFAFAAALLAIALVLPIAASADRGTVVDRYLQFAALPHGWLFGIPRDVRQEARLVGRVGGHKLAVAPTRNGNFCESFQGVVTGCRVRGAGVIGPNVIGSDHRLVAVGGTVVSDATTAVGHTNSRLYARIGSHETRVPMTWVSAPINAAFFYFDVPRTVRSVTLVLKRYSGEVVATTPRLHVKYPN